MQRVFKPILLISAVLAIPIVPFVIFGQPMEDAVEAWLAGGLSRPVMFMAVVGLLASDIFLPIPSSAVSTVAGNSLGFFVGTAASWCGMTLGAVFAFALARLFGPPLTSRLAKSEDVKQMELLSRRIGPAILVITRAVPVLAEAGVLWFGLTQLSWRRFIPPVALANLGIAAVYAALGSWVRLPVAFAASLAIPFVLTIAWRIFYDRNKKGVF